MNFRAIIEPKQGSDIGMMTFDFPATDFDAACHFVNVTMSQLGLKGMSTVLRLDGEQDKTGMVTLQAGRARRPCTTCDDTGKEGRHSVCRDCFDCDDPATDCHMNCGPASDPH